MQKIIAVLGAFSVITGCGGYSAPQPRTSAPSSADAPPVPPKRPAPIPNDAVFVQEVSQSPLSVRTMIDSVDADGIPFVVLDLRNLRATPLTIALEWSEGPQPFEIAWEVRAEEPKNDGTEAMIEKHETRTTALTVTGVGFSESMIVPQVPDYQSEARTIRLKPIKDHEEPARLAFYARSVGEKPMDRVREFDVRVLTRTAERIRRVEGKVSVAAAKILGFPRLAMYAVLKDGTKIPIYQ